ncbi:MFS general substrate transporter [Mollisia scopiformis]|uniref:MFS general substrate transporter n=1 Tax=Mollisia scopiformis TaxID=149040 RepID=A0A194XLZ3_MOLSC|nr:MFS general substrate transporter [Mollisia scopiformis]KUJ21265.1 MFS general substrate transporter [Mollisia scopiformis]
MAAENRPLLPKNAPFGTTDAIESLTSSPKNVDEWKPSKRLRWVQIATWANIFLSGFDTTIALSTYAVIGSEFDAANQVSWISTAYLITATAFQPLYGSFSDILGRRDCFVASISLFLSGTTLCGLASSMWMLNIGRGMAGIGGGGLFTMATIILSDMVPFHKRGFYQAANNTVYGFGTACGASIGGLLASKLGWRFGFLFQIPICLFGIVIGYVLIPQNNSKLFPEQARSERVDNRERLKRLDILGAGNLIIGLAMLLAALNMGGNVVPWNSIRVIGFFVASTIFLCSFLLVETNMAQYPIIPMRMLRGRVAVVSIFLNVFAGMAVYSYMFLIPLFFQAVLLESPANVGVRLILPSIMFPIGGFVSGWIMSRWNLLAHLVRTGTVIVAAGCALAMIFNEKTSYWEYFACLLPVNFGQGLVYPSSLFLMLAGFTQKDQAIATSTVYLFRNVGSVMGVAIGSAIVQNALLKKLSASLADVPDAEKIIHAVRHSVEAICDISLEYRSVVITCYLDSLRYGFAACTFFAALAFLSSFFGKNSIQNR